MKFFVGLGNPGPRYETTRHNAGFLAIDRLIETWNAKSDGKKFNAEIYSCQVAGERVILSKPLTMMNLSGQSVGPMLGFYKGEVSDLVVLHDDLDLRSMSLRVKQGGGTGGHNGLKSIDQSLGGKQDYVRVRLGVGRPEGDRARMDPADYVLEQYSDTELNDLDKVLDQVVEVCAMLVRGEVLKAMNQFNKKEKEV